MAWFRKKGLAAAPAELRNEAIRGRAQSGGCVQSGYAGPTLGYQKRWSMKPRILHGPG
jgi:hypothetical protein